MCKLSLSSLFSARRKLAAFHGDVRRAGSGQSAVHLNIQEIKALITDGGGRFVALTKKEDLLDRLAGLRSGAGTSASASTSGQEPQTAGSVAQPSSSADRPVATGSVDRQIVSEGEPTDSLSHAASNAAALRAAKAEAKRQVDAFSGAFHAAKVLPDSHVVWVPTAWSDAMSRLISSCSDFMEEVQQPGSRYECIRQCACMQCSS